MNYPGNVTPQNSDDQQLTLKKILLAFTVFFGGGGGGGGSPASITIKPPSASLLIADTSAHTGTWNAIQVDADAVFTLLTGTLTGYSTNTFHAGTTLYGSFTAITLASGQVIANSP